MYRWWLLPLALVVGAAITILKPTFVLFSVFIVAAAGLQIVRELRSTGVGKAAAREDRALRR